MEASKGYDSTRAALWSVLKGDKLAQKIAALHDLGNLDLLIITVVGAVYPMLRTHTLLSALQPIMGSTPLLMFFPGRYDGHALRLFNTLAEDHYYCAFWLAVFTTPPLRMEIGVRELAGCRICRSEGPNLDCDGE